MIIKHPCVLMHIRIKGEAGTVKFKLSGIFGRSKAALLLWILLLFEPRHEIPNNVVFATRKCSDQSAHTRSLIRALASRLTILRLFKLLAEHHLEFLSLKGECTGLSESILVKMPYCWKSHVTAHLCFMFVIIILSCLFLAALWSAAGRGLTSWLMGGSRWGEGVWTPPPLKNHKNIGFPSNIDPDPLNSKSY